MTGEEKWDRFRMGLKPQVRLEVMKSGKTTFDEGSTIALNVDSALCGIGMFSGHNQNGFRVPSSDVRVPMDFRNIERNLNTGTGDIRLGSNKCWVCKKNGCRSWKHSEDVKKVLFNNVNTRRTAGEIARISKN